MLCLASSAYPHAVPPMLALIWSAPESFTEQPASLSSGESPVVPISMAWCHIFCLLGPGWLWAGRRGSPGNATQFSF
ncbi:hypothetical protein O3P69_005117 [Scylla paramamosain]|uniref:Uncharacterized protein n=1 Tax=Scylla paramamosain TaxID=85552 RepID=A0AAW0UB16_SCYPA